MTELEIYTPAELEGLRKGAEEGRTLECPRCGSPLTNVPVPPRREVSYVRRRSWWLCPTCRLSAVLDEP